ncbi:protein of unknown function [Magnetospirillum sp. XM-1]|uniref:methyltransferase domain-containing protein n=1 Tax=Magnetospirillum sp. XM-1 TaxID=1663591 RepID=UPI00073DE8EE|nr:methyltransferase domain-containing protein [Magnetospirillum sp. XM-1]CUW37975.1 protein of unknown function [Magnetospirillum sp. XM-1]
MSTTEVRCLLCGTGAVVARAVPLPIIDVSIAVSIVHADWRLGVCQACGASHRLLSATEAARIDGSFKSADYIDRRQVPQTVHVKDRPAPTARHVLQAELLMARMAPHSRLLDFGCHDGALLGCLAERRGDMDLVGYDVGDRPPASYPAGVAWIGGARDAIPGRFDAIVLSYSLQYVRDLGALGAFLRERLLPGGFVLIQVPDVARKPAVLLLGNQHHFFTTQGMAAVLHHIGFAYEPLERDWAARDALGFATPAAEPGSALASGPVCDAVFAALDEIVATGEGLAKLAGGGRYGVLGTTVEAALAGDILGADAAYFVDENPGKAGQTFFGRAIIHPRELTAADTVILPYGKAGDAIGRRLASEYKGRFLVV